MAFNSQDDEKTRTIGLEQAIIGGGLASSRNSYIQRGCQALAGPAKHVLQSKQILSETRTIAIILYRIKATE